MSIPIRAVEAPADLVAQNTLPWRVETLNFDNIDLERAAANEDLMLLLCACSFIESGSDLYTTNLVEFFKGDAEICQWLTEHWEPEESQHGRSLRAYIERVWPDFEWEIAFNRFFKEFSKICSIEEYEKTRALEMVGRCVIETGTATLYRAIRDACNEPVLKELTDHIRNDEVRHYKYFLRYFNKNQKIERKGRFSILGALIRRVLELRNDDAEIALRHAFKSRYIGNRKPPAGGLKHVSRRVNRIVRRNLSADMCIKMLLKPLALPQRVYKGIHYPLAKFTQHVLFR